MTPTRVTFAAGLGILYTGAGLVAAALLHPGVATLASTPLLFGVITFPLTTLGILLGTVPPRRDAASATMWRHISGWGTLALVGGLLRVSTDHLLRDLSIAVLGAAVAGVATIPFVALTRWIARKGTDDQAAA